MAPDQKIDQSGTHVDRVLTAQKDALEATIDEFTPEEQRKIKHRIDRRLIVPLGLMYCVSLIDRGNLGLAVVAGMAVDLRLIGTRYNILALVFFITYVLAQPPAVLLMRRIGARLFLSMITILWGLAMLSSGFVKEWYELIPLRLLLGLFEAGLFPTSAFAGVVGYGLSRLEDHGRGPAWWGQHYGPTTLKPEAPSGIREGIAGWRWLFIIEGALTCLVGLGVIPFIVDFPELCNKKLLIKFLNAREVNLVIAKIEKDRHDVDITEFTWKRYLSGALDLKLWGFALCFCCNSVNTYGIAYFLPIILRDGMGFGVAASQCLASPPYIAAIPLLFTYAWLGDKYHIRSPWIVVNCLLLLTGQSLLAFSTKVGARYFGVFMATAACNANIPVLLTWQANNIRGQWKRALCSATLVGAGGIGGIAGTLVFRAQDSPKYVPGITACLVASAIILTITLLLDLKFWFANKRVRAGGKLIGGLEGFEYTL